MKRILLAFLVALFFSCPVFAETTATLGGQDSDGNYYWTVDDDGTLIGATGAKISLGGEEKSSWGDIVSPMTDQDGYTTTTDAGSKLKLHDDGGLTLGGGVATDVAITFDSDTNDYYIATNDTENELQIGYGSVVGTTEQISIQSSGSIVIGENTDVDSGFIFQAGAQDYYMGIDYTGNTEEDLFCIGLGSTIGTTPELSIGKASGAVYVNLLDAPGNVDLDVGSADVDDVTITTDGGTIILDGSITLDEGEIISNTTLDDTVRIESNDLDTILEVYTSYDTTGDATLKLTADVGDAAKEQWTITSTGDGNDLVIANDYSVSGTPVTKLTLEETGVLTTTSYIDSKITDTTTNGVVDVLKLTHDGGAAAAGVGTGLVFQVDDAGGIEEQGSIDVSLSTVTNGSEDADMIVSLNQAGTIREVLKIDSDLGDAGTNVLEYTGWTTEANGIVDLVELKLDTTGDTATDGLGMGISFQLEDETDVVEEQASLDIIVTDAATTAENTDLVINLNNIGTIREAFRIDTDVTADAGTAFEMTGWTIETNGVIDMLELKLENTADTATNNFGLGVSFQLEDETSVEEHASIDVVLTDAARATCDSDFIFNQDVAGTMAERVRFDADGPNILVSGATPYITIGDNEAEDTKLLFDGIAQEFHVGLDDNVDDLVIGVGTALGTTTALAIDENTDITTSGNLIVEGALDLGTVETFGDTDATPDVSDGSYFITHGTGACETITDFDGTGIVAGQIIVIETNDDDITFDVTSSGLKGGTTDIVTSDGDTTTWIYNGTDWLLISYMDMAEDLN